MSRSFIEFAVGTGHLALSTAALREVVGLVALETIPGAHAPVRGEMNFGGRLVTVYDLRDFFAIARRDALDTAILMLTTPRGLVGLVVDRVEGIVDGEVVSPEGGSVGPAWVEGVIACPERLVHAVDPQILVEALRARAAQQD